MTPQRVYERFVQEFPHLDNQIKRWFHRRSDDNGDSIRVMLKNGNSLIFTVYGDGTWILKR